MADLRDFDAKGPIIFEESYVDDFSGVPRKRHKVKRDYEDRIIQKGEDLISDRDELLAYHVHRSEEQDIDP